MVNFQIFPILSAVFGTLAFGCACASPNHLWSPRNHSYLGAGFSDFYRSFSFIRIAGSLFLCLLWQIACSPFLFSQPVSLCALRTALWSVSHLEPFPSPAPFCSLALTVMRCLLSPCFVLWHFFFCSMLETFYLFCIFLTLILSLLTDISLSFFFCTLPFCSCC